MILFFMNPRSHLLGAVLRSHVFVRFYSSVRPSAVFRMFFHSPYPVTPLLATLTKTAGACTNSSQFRTRLDAPLGMPSNSHTPSFSISYPLLFPALAHSFAHFCTYEKLNSFLFRRFRTLSQKINLRALRHGAGRFISHV